MTSRQRVAAALSHIEPDRVPIDFGGHRSSGISAIGYAKLKRALGIDSGDIYVYDMVQQLAIVEPDVLDAVGADVVELGRGFMLDDSDWRDWTLPDGTPCKIPAFINVEKRGTDSFLVSDDGVDLAIQKQDFLYFEQIHWPWLDRNPDQQEFSNSELQQAFKYTMWTGIPTPGGHIPLTDEGLAELTAGARKLRESTDRAILGIFGGNLFEVPQFLYRIDNYLTHMGFCPEACVRLSEALCDFYMPRMEKWLGAVGPYIDVMLFGDDLGGTNGPLMSTEMYRTYYKPWHAKLWRRAKELAPHVNVHLHCCGGIEPLLGDLIDAGLESSNPVQITCKGMNPSHLKSTFGNRFTFWGGGCDTRHALPNGTPDEVARNVRDLVSIWSPGGGFVFQQVHNILADVPTENIIAMFNAARGLE
ncbi:MAG: uroporphyrinogen decarboxylase family protein [Phycisphaerae bacterium]|jgi:uroporphyrinogen decarboxylase|nr:uroporphyrinogen decarboxylase family protein [Phycisphaerae bacterium]